ncbi:hypothetical protein MKX01_006751 [Papaver californicum]|nr:hypothetical protein MKX01_006751 [Papaver californicum]
MIQDDPYFIDLHLRRSKLHPCLTLAIPRTSHSRPPPGTCSLVCRPYTADILIGDLSETAEATPIIQNVQKTTSIQYDGVLKSVNGLICFTDTPEDFGVCIYNLGTRELSPWIPITFPIDEGNFVWYHPTYQFGFDPATKEHKVICIWYEDIEGCKGSEVMTLGDNTWRIIDEVPQHNIEEDDETSAVYANGSIYWITYSKQQIVAFDKSGKFRTIEVPKFITGHKEFKTAPNIFEVNGRVALSSKVRGGLVNLWILDDDDSTTNDCSQNWTELTVTLELTINFQA